MVLSQSGMDKPAPRVMQPVRVEPAKEQWRREARADHNLKTKTFAYCHGHSLSNASSLQRELSYYSYFLNLYSNKLSPAAHSVSTSSFFEATRQGTLDIEVENPAIILLFFC